MISLRPYQENIISLVKKAFLSGKKHVIVQAPTGSGKTVIFSYISLESAKRNKKVLILTDRGELLLQAGGSLKNFGINPFYIQAGCNFINHNHNIYVAMSQTLRRRIDLPQWRKFIQQLDLVIIDECHKQEFNYLFESKLLDNKLVIGFTATPKRSGKMRQLALDYEEIISTVSVSELIELGYLVKDDYFGCSSPDVSGVSFDKLKCDYDEKELFSRYNSPVVYAGAVKNYKTICQGPGKSSGRGSQAIVFCVNIEHTIKTCLEFRKEGIMAKFIVSDVSKPHLKDFYTEAEKARYDERKRIYDLYHDNFIQCSGDRSRVFAEFAQKEIQVLINTGIATTGYDCPGIEAVIALRATLSLSLWLQMIGRGSRPNEGKDSFSILDFGDNAKRLKCHYTQVVRWDLWHSETSGTGIPPMKECGYDSKGIQIEHGKGCRRLILASYKICPFCGFKYPDKKQKEIELSTVIFNGKSSVSVKKISDMNNDELFQYYEMKRHSPTWLWRQLYFRGGVEMLENFGRSKGWTKGTISRSRLFCENLESAKNILV